MEVRSAAKLNISKAYPTKKTNNNNNNKERCIKGYNDSGTSHVLVGQSSVARVASVTLPRYNDPIYPARIKNNIFNYKKQ